MPARTSVFPLLAVKKQHEIGQLFQGKADAVRAAAGFQHRETFHLQKWSASCAA
jgi:hypothetical protein